MKPSYEELEVMLQDALDKIKASQDQEVFSYVYRGTEPVALYLQPPIPPELAELQRRIVELEAQLRK